MTGDSRSVRDPDSELRYDTGLALAAAASLQTSIRHADTKAATLMGGLGGLTAFVAERIASSVGAGRGPAVSVTAPPAVVLICASAVAAWLLLQALSPRLDGPPVPNRFAFPSGARSVCRPVAGDAHRRREEAWALVSVLAATAKAKHRCVRRSVPWMVLAAAAGLALVVTSTLA